jgi:hypothetical protein
MAVSRKTIGLTTFILSCLLVTLSGVAVMRWAPGGSWPAAGATPWSLPGRAGGPESTPFAARQPMVLPPDRLPDLPGHPEMSSVTTPLASWDRVLVEVRHDGSLQVLGEQMEREAFRLLVSQQLREQLNLVVTICPDDNCPFRHVGRVISICEEAGVPHQTLPGPVRAGIGVPPGGPA